MIALVARADGKLLEAREQYANNAHPKNSLICPQQS
jgi:hypothetical protein